MPRRQHAFRKPRPQNGADRNPQSALRRALGKLIGRTAYAEALAQLNSQLAAGGLDEATTAEVFCYAADVLFAQGKFDEAADAFGKAAGHAFRGAGWLRPAVGRVRSLLKGVQVEAAFGVAHEAVADGARRRQVYQQELAQAQAALAADRPAVVPAQPLRDSVIATRFARLFFQEGELEFARTLWQEALAMEPQGATKARLGLAEIALREGRVADASRLAADALRVGKFRAKTLPAWPLLLKADFQQGKTELNPSLLLGLQQTKAGVRARATLLIVRTLRGQHHPQWAALANQWLAANPNGSAIVAAEFKKLMLASKQREAGDALGQLAAAVAVRETRGISAQEFLAAAKEQVRASCFADSPTSWSALVAQGVSRFGEEFRGRLTHSLALSYMMGRRHGLARPLLEANMIALPATNLEWSKSVWALARMENFLGNYPRAAQLYQQVYRQPAVPVRFRLQAQIRWLDALVMAGDHPSINAARGEILAAVGQIEDYETLLDFSRQLFWGPEGLALAHQVFELGKTRAIALFQASVRPAEALKVLFKLTRRQILDFHDSAGAVAFWEQSVAGKIDWLWADTTQFWSYLALVFEGITREKRMDEAVALAVRYLEDKATSSEGRVILGIPYGLWLIKQGQSGPALELFSLLIDESPSHPLCAAAYYWLAIAALKQGDQPMADRYAARVQAVQGINADFFSQRELESQALLIRAEMNVDLVSRQIVNYDAQRFQEAKEAIVRDMASI
jgi:tetratricopeptide (TPR) repeat protein